MKTLFLTTLALLMAACSHQASNSQLTDAPNAAQGLHAVNNTRFDAFFVAPDTSLADYRSLRFMPLDANELEIDTNRLEFVDRNKWKLTQKDIEKMTKTFGDRVSRTYKNNKALSLAEHSGPGVADITFKFKRFSPNAPKDDLVGRPARQKVFTRGVGLLEISATITDSQSGKVIAYLEDKEEVGERFYLERNNRVENMRKLRLEIDGWLRKLNQSLEQQS